MVGRVRKPAAKAKTAFGPRDQQLVGYQELAKAAERDRDQALAARGEALRALEAEAIKGKNAAAEFSIKLDHACDDIAALKGELATAYATIERQAGYLDRVHEGDALRDEPHWQLPTEPPARPGPRIGPVAVYVRSRGEENFSGRVMRAEAEHKPWWTRGGVSR